MFYKNKGLKEFAHCNSVKFLFNLSVPNKIVVSVNIDTKVGSRTEDPDCKEKTQEFYDMYISEKQDVILNWNDAEFKFEIEE